jgi:hypothetical protein
VLRTLPKASGRDFDRWVEEIYVDQTRGYVKRVTGTYGIYHFLYDPETPIIDLPAHVPARVKYD